MEQTGTHVIVDVWGADARVLNDPPALADALEAACRKAGATLLGRWTKAFAPQGVTVLIGLAESHASIHTYPERGYYAADIFTCGKLNPTEAIVNLVRRLGGRAKGLIIPRGEGLGLKFEPVELTFEPSPIQTSSGPAATAGCSSSPAEPGPAPARHALPAADTARTPPTHRPR